MRRIHICSNMLLLLMNNQAPTSLKDSLYENVFLCMFLLCAQVSNRLRRISSSGIISTIAGTGLIPNTYGASVPATSVNIQSPASVAVDSKGAIYVADALSVRKIRCPP